MKRGQITLVAKVAGVSRTMISLMLKGERRPHWESAKRMGKRLGLDPVLLVDGTKAQLTEAFGAVKKGEPDGIDDEANA